MIFGEVAVADCAGAILAHSLKLPKGIMKKGRALTAADAATLTAAGIRTVVAARLEAGDVGENEAAAELARAVAGDNVSVGAAFTGRTNLFADCHGLAMLDRAAVDRFNSIDERVTLATVMPAAAVELKQMVATLKIIPFAVPRSVLDECLAAARAGGALLRIAPFKVKRVALIQTTLPGFKESILAKTVETTRERLAALGSPLLLERRVEHASAALAPLIAEAIAAGADLVLVAGASAIQIGRAHV